MNKNLPKGYLYALLYCLVFGGSSVWTHAFQQTRDPNLTIFFSFSLSLIIFLILNISHFKKLKALVTSHFKTVFWINILSLIMCVAYFWALKFISSSLYIGIFMATLPLFSLLTHLKSNLNRRTIIGALCILTFSVWVIHLQSSLHPSQEFIIGLVTTLGGSLAAVYYFSSTKNFQDAEQVSSLEILALRFILVTIAAFIACCLTHSFEHIATNDFYSFGGLALANSLLFYFAQQAILYLGVLRVSYFIPITPVISYVIELLTGQTELNLLMLLGISALSFSIIAFSFKKKTGREATS